MSSLSPSEIKNFEELLGMRSGYVHDFTNSSFSDFFYHFNINIYSDKYDKDSGSKANRLRAFWTIGSDEIVGTVMDEMLKMVKTISNNRDLKQECQKAVDRLLQRKNEVKEFTEESLMNQSLKVPNLVNLKLESQLEIILKQRFMEIEKCLRQKAALAAIFLCGSTMEGLLLNVANNNPKQFNTVSSSPKEKSGKVKSFTDWTLNDLINVAHSTDFVSLDVKKFSHTLREFRNFIHPYEQMICKFNPDMNTAKICWEVLKLAILDLTGERD